MHGIALSRPSDATRSPALPRFCAYLLRAFFDQPGALRERVQAWDEEQDADRWRRSSFAFTSPQVARGGLQTEIARRGAITRTS
jgi:hypothetical protein